MKFLNILIIIGIMFWSLHVSAIEPPFLHENVAPPAKKWDFTPVLTARSVLVMDRASSQIIFEKNKDTPLPMASITKLMTALLLLERNTFKETVTVPEKAIEVTGSALELEAGEIFSLQDLFEGMLMRSGNDAALALAIHAEKSVSHFVKKMNEQAKAFEFFGTRYQNPHGLDDKEHFSTARDTALLFKKLLEYPLFRSTIAQKRSAIVSQNIELEHAFVNTNQLVGTIFSRGGKTGTTDNAGQCIVFLVQVKKREYIIVILGSEDRYLDAKTLLYPLFF